MRCVLAAALCMVACAKPVAETADETAPQPAATEPVAAEPAATEPTSQPTAQADGYTPSPSVTADDGSERFGAPPGEGTTLTLATLLKAPADYAGKKVKVSGTVERVCKNMGCWVELRQEGQHLRAPMAGHALSIPQRVLGRTVTVEGEVELRELTAQQKAHYAAEGMTATEHAVSIFATTVLVMK